MKIRLFYNKAVLASLTALLALTVLAGCSSAPPEPPIANVIPHTDTIHGDIRVDDYYWLRERENPEVIAYLEAENAYTEEVMGHTKDFQEKLFQEIKGRIKETDLSVPVRNDSFYYYSRQEEGLQYGIYCRKKGSLEADEEILLDVNKLAEGHDFFSVYTYSVSPDHSLMAYGVDTSGNEHYTVYIKDLTSGQLLKDIITDTDGGVTWAADNETFFYSTMDSTYRPDKVYRHKLATDQANDALIYHEADPVFGVYFGKSLSEEYLFLIMWANASSEYRYLKADNPTGQFKMIQPRQPMVEYQVTHHGDRFYILTNEDAENFRLMSAPVSNPKRSSWKEIIPERDSVLIEDVTAFKDYMAVVERENGLRQLRIRNFNNNEKYYVDFPEPIYYFRLTGNAEYTTDSIRFSYYSLVTPKSVFDYCMGTKERVLKKQTEVLGGYNPDEYKSERIFATAPDGIKVPISLVYKKSLKKDGPQPLYLRGYGSYGSSSDTYFASSRLSLIDRGFIFAIAHVRGGSEMGRWWYEQGRLKNKMNTFTDFIACAEHLVVENYTSPDSLVINGGSAGGLLMGAVVNLRPDLFRICVADVPFVDVVNTMLDPTIPLTTNEYTEWGNPEEEDYYRYMMTYSPYDNVEAKDYPNMLITAGLNDPRVQYWEPAKWTAKLRQMKTDQNRLLLKTNMGAGHGGASGRYDYLKEIAFEFAFILDIMGITK